MDPESSMTKIVSNMVKKAYGSSAERMLSAVRREDAAERLEGAGEAGRIEMPTAGAARAGVAAGAGAAVGLLPASSAISEYGGGGSWTGHKNR